MSENSTPLVTPAAPTPTPAPTPSPAPSPKISFGTESSRTDKSDTQLVPTTPAPQTVPDKYEFDFADGEKHEFTVPEESAQPVDSAADSVDYNKPFDPKMEELLKSDPVALRQAKRAHFENREFKRFFKSPKEAEAQVKRIETLGGLDHVEKESGEWSTIYAGFQAGDPGVIDAWLGENPVGLAKLTAPYLEKLAKANPKVFSHEMAKVFVSTLYQQDASGMSTVTALNQLSNAVADNPEASKLLGFVAKQLNEIYNLSNQVPDELTKTVAQTQAAEPVTNNERFQMHLQTVNARTQPIVQTAVKQALKTALKGRKISSAMENDLAQEIESQFNKMSQKNVDFNENGKALLTSKETDKFIRLLKAHLVRTLPIAAKNVVRKYASFGGTDAVSQPREPSAGASVPGTLKYTGRMIQGAPDPAVLDYQRMRASSKDGIMDMLAKRQAFLKGKKEIYTY